MANKLKELNPQTETPIYSYQLTPRFMLGYIQRDDVSKAKKKRFARLCKDNMKVVMRRKTTIAVLDTIPVRLWFAKEFFPHLLEAKKEDIELSFINAIEALLED